MRMKWGLVATTLAIVAALALAAPQARAAEKMGPLVESAVFAERGDVKLGVDIYRPAGEGPFPGVLVIHGGAWASGDKAHMTFICRELMRRGYVAANINYRLAPSYMYPAQVEDCEDALRWLHERADELRVDADRLGTFGYSAGGHLALLLAAKPREANGDDKPLPPVKACVAGGAPCDFRALPENFTGLAYWLGGPRGQRPEVYRLASPAEYFSKSMPPVFFYHGDADALVPFLSVRKAHAELKRLGVPTSLYVLEGAGHIQVFFDPDPVEKAIHFLDKHLAE